jgi:PAS domain S-box-containing protein
MFSASNIFNFAALILGAVTLYKSAEFLHLTRGNVLAWYFVGAVLLIMIRRIDSILDLMYDYNPSFMDVERLFNPLLVKCCLLIFIAKLVSLYRNNFTDLTAVRGVQSAALPIVQIDSSGMITYVNQALEELTGFFRDDLIGKPLITILPERYRKRHQEAFAKYVQSGTRTLNWSSIKGHVLTNHDGEHEVPVEIALGDFPVGTTKGFIGILRRRDDN